MNGNESKRIATIYNKQKTRINPPNTNVNQYMQNTDKYILHCCIYMKLK